MDFRLRHGISWCLCNEQLVLLDLYADRYLALPPAQERAFLCWASGEEQGADGDASRSLVEIGILVPGQAEADCAAAKVDRPARDLHASGQPAASPWRVMQASLAQGAARRSLRRHRLADLLRAIRDRPMGGGPGEPTAAQIASAFDGAAILLSKTDQCLPRALAAWSMCRRCGIEANLVFGVRVEPFAAHCWVQLGDAVLVGEYEHARLYTPILVER